MGWNARIVVPFTALFVLLSTAVVIGILRIGGLIGWPPIWVVIVLFIALLPLLALLLVSAAGKAASEGGGRGGPYLVPVGLVSLLAPEFPKLPLKRPGYPSCGRSALLC